MITELKAWCLKTIYRNKRAFINFDDLKKRGMDKKAVEQALKSLENKGLVRKKKGIKSSLYQYGLVDKNMQEIEESIKQHYPEFVSFKELYT